MRRYRAEAATYCARVCDRTEVLCAVSRLVVVRPVGAAPVRCVYSRPGASPQADFFLYNCWLQHVEGPRPGSGWCTGSAQRCREHCRITRFPTKKTRHTDSLAPRLVSDTAIPLETANWLHYHGARLNPSNGGEGKGSTDDITTHKHVDQRR